MSLGSESAGRLGRSDESDGSSVARRWLLLLCSLLCGLLLSQGSALAFSQRSHVVGTPFGSTGEGLGQLKEPGAVAVSESSGDIYVADRGNNRIDQFGPTGAPIAVWGFGVSDGEQKFEVCKSPGPCKAGTGKGALISPGAIAVDNSGGPSAGDVYAVLDSRAKHGTLWKLSAEGEKLAVLGQEGVKPFKWEGTLDGVAVDSSGTVSVYRAVTAEEGTVEKFSGAVENEFKSALEPTLESEELEKREEVEAPFCPKPGFAVDAAGEHVYVNHERINVEERCPEQVRIEEKEEKVKEPKEKLRSVVTAKVKFNSAEELFEGESTGLESQNTAAVAVDQASSASTPLGEAAKGDAYLATGATVAAIDSGGGLIQRIEHLPGTAPQTSGVAIDSATGVLYVADSANGQIDVLEPAPPSRPIVDSVFPQDQTPTATKLFARIDPDGAKTEYTVQYGTAACLSEPAACTTIHGELPAVFGDQTVEVQLSGLQPDTTYYYHVIARNGHEPPGESPRIAQTFFTTLPSAKGLLTDSREWEMVSPPQKGGPLGAPSREGPAAVQAAEGGGALAYGSFNSGPIGEAEGNRSIATSQFLFTLGASEWSGQDITTPRNKGEGLTPGGPPEYRLFSSDLSLSIVEPEVAQVEPLEQPPLSPPLSEKEKGHQEKTIYLRDDPPIAPDAAEKTAYDEAAMNHEYLAPGYVALVSELNDTAGSKFGISPEGGSGLELLDASPDLSHVVFGSAVPLISGAAGEGLYESSAGSNALALVSVGPKKEANLGPQLGGLGDSRNAISGDGASVVFTSAFVGASGENEAAFLFMRDTATQTTIQINAAQGVAEPGELEQENGAVDHVAFQEAAGGGSTTSKVFFKDTWPLTGESTQHPTENRDPSDLYEFNVETGKLADLTIPEHLGESADVLGTIPGTSEDGSNVYFIANGVLAPGAAPGHCTTVPTAGATCSLYVSKEEAPGVRKVRFIATLSNEDEPDWGLGSAHAEGSLEGALIPVSSRVSPGGRYLAFMSDRELTGYDNVDSNPAAKGAHDEEVYLYDATLGRVVCASCNPSGAPPAGVFDTPKAGEGEGLLVDRSEIWKERWIAGSIPGWTPLGTGVHGLAIYQPRYLSDSGRLFFNSADALVAQDKNHKEDVYEYEPESVGSCGSANGCVALISSGAATAEHESAFLDASKNGGDAFFLTSVKLRPRDTDSAYDIYDARICGTPESSACLPEEPPPPVECVGEACKTESLPPPSFSTSQSATFSGPGNTPTSGVLPTKTTVTPKPLTKAQKLAKALKACHKVKKKKARAACEKHARKLYGPKSKAKKAKHARSSARGRTR